MHIHRSGIGFGVQSPDIIHQFLSGKNAVWIRKKLVQKVKLLLRKHHNLRWSTHLQALVIQGDASQHNLVFTVNTTAAQELGKGILERVLTYCEYKATDDMTVLAAGLWRK